MSNTVAHFSVRLFALYFLFLSSCGLLIEGEFIHSDGLDFTAGSSVHIDEEMVCS